MGVYNVHNLREGGRDGNWLKYWENATGMKAQWCHRVDCISPLLAKATDGAHFSVRGPLVSATDPNVILW